MDISEETIVKGLMNALNSNGYTIEILAGDQMKNAVPEFTDVIAETIKKINYDTIIGEVMENKISGIHHYITIKNNNQYILKCTSWGKSYKNIKIGNIVKIEGSLKFMKKMFSIYYNIKK